MASLRRTALLTLVLIVAFSVNTDVVDAFAAGCKGCVAPCVCPGKKGEYVSILEQKT